MGLFKKACNLFMKWYDKCRDIMQMFTPIPLPDPIRMVNRVYKKIRE